MVLFRTVFIVIAFLLAALVAGPWIALQFEASFPAIDLPWIAAIGEAFVAIGALLAFLCLVSLFLPGALRVAPAETGGTFIIAGPYRYMRNPFMLGVMLVLWGEALIMAHFVMIGYAFLFTWLMYFWVILYEEPALRRSIGRDYQTYLKAVPRWLPRLKRYEPTRSS